MSTLSEQSWSITLNNPRANEKVASWPLIHMPKRKSGVLHPLIRSITECTLRSRLCLLSSTLIISLGIALELSETLYVTRTAI